MPPSSTPPAMPTRPVDQSAVLHARLDAMQESFLSAIKSMRDDVCGHLHRIEEDASTVRAEVTELKTWRGTASDRVGALDGEVKKVSSNDLAQDATLAAEIVKRETFEREAAAREAVFKKDLADARALNMVLAGAATSAQAFLKKPSVQIAIGIAWSSLLVYAARHGITIPPIPGVSP